MEHMIKFLSPLELRGIERKVDLVVKDPTEEDRLIYRYSKGDGREDMIIGEASVMCPPPEEMFL